jgi:hypothetical protein
VVGPHPHGLPVREMVRPQPKLIQPAAHIPPPIPFKSGQAPTLGPDAPNALKRAGLGSGSPGGPGQSGPHSALLPAKPAAAIPSTMPSPASRYPASLPGTSVAPGSVARPGSPTPGVAAHMPDPVQPPAGYERESFPNSGRRGLSAPMVHGLSAPMVHAPPSQQHFRRPDGALQLPPDVTARRSPPGNVDPPIHAQPNAAIPHAAPLMGQAPAYRHRKTSECIRRPRYLRAQRRLSRTYSGAGRSMASRCADSAGTRIPTATAAAGRSESV